MTPELFLRIAIEPALALLPPRMDTPAARAMILAICLQESAGLKHRRQVLGPARGFPQFEVGGIRGILGHKASKAHLANALEALAYPVTNDATVPYVAIEHNDVLAAVCARLLLWTLPTPLPCPDTPAEAYEQYIKAWRPGRPHPETWAEYYRSAWALVGAEV